MTAKTRDELVAFLDSLGIAVKTRDHPPVFTVEESKALRDEIPGGHTKNLFLKDAGGAFWLVTVPAQARVDLKALPHAIGCKRVSFGKADDMERLLGVAPGSVTPLAMIEAQRAYEISSKMVSAVDEMLRNANQTL